LLGVLFGVAGMGSTTASVVLPELAREFDVTVAQGAWSVSLYVLTLGVTTALYGRISDLIGLRGPLAAGLGLLTGGAVLAALAPTYGVHLAGRLLQGAGAAAVPTLGVAAITARYDGAVRSTSLGQLAGMAAVLSGLGPLIGGAADAVGGWRSAIVLPALSLLVLPFVWHALATEGTRGRLDVVGAVLVAGASGAMVLLLQSPSTGSSMAIASLAMVVVGAVAVFLWVRRTPHGFLPLQVIGNGVIVRSGLAGAAIIAGWFAIFVCVPVILLAAGWQPVEVGLLLVPGAAVGFVTPRFAGRVILRVGSARALSYSCLCAGVAVCLGAAGAEWSSPVVLGAAGFVITACFGLGQPALMESVGAAVDSEMRGVALGVATLLFLTGGSFGAAIVGGLGDMVGLPASLCVVAVLPLLGALATLGLPSPGDPKR